MVNGNVGFGKDEMCSYKHTHNSAVHTVEQALIEIHGLGKNGGTLLNRINSISPTNPVYSSQLQRGYELLKSIGYSW